MTLAIVIPDYSEYGIPGPYFGDRVFDELERYTQKAEKVSVKINRFPDTSEKADIVENVRDRNLYFIHSLYMPTAAQHVVTAVQMLDAARRSRSSSNAVVELFNPYHRQDSRWGREPVSARLIADLYVESGMDYYITTDPHSKQIVGFYPAAEPLPMSAPLARHFRNNYELGNAVVAPPDRGAYATAEQFANLLGLGFAVLHKDRKGVEDVRIKDLLGDVARKDVIILDDVISTATTTVTAANYLRERGAKKIYACATHLVLCNNARQKLLDADVHVVGTNTIPHQFTEEEKRHFDVLDVSPLIAHVIDLDYRGESISRFFINEIM